MHPIENVLTLHILYLAVVIHANILYILNRSELFISSLPLWPTGRVIAATFT